VPLIKKYEKDVCVNFINVLRADFADPESAKKTDKLSVFLALLGSVHIKAARRTLMKLTPDILKSQQITVLNHCTFRMGKG